MKVELNNTNEQNMLCGDMSIFSLDIKDKQYFNLTLVDSTSKQGQPGLKALCPDVVTREDTEL